MVKIAVIGNCQSEKIQLLIKAMSPNVTCYVLDGVHKLSEEQREKYLNVFHDVDFIFTHKISNNYHIEYVRTNFLTAGWPEKVVTFTNFWFNGYDPSFVIPLNKNNLPYDGPLGPNHFRQIIEAYASGKSVQQAVDCWQKMVNFEKKAINLFERSLIDLVNRDAECHVRCASFINEYYNIYPITHTVNHPCINFLIYAAKSILNYISIPYTSVNVNALPDYFKLDFIDISPNKYIADYFEIKFDYNNLYRGYDLVEGVYDSTGGVKFYDTEELVEHYYNMYRSAWADDAAQFFKAIE